MFEIFDLDINLWKENDYEKENSIENRNSEFENKEIINPILVSNRYLTENENLRSVNLNQNTNLQRDELYFEKCISLYREQLEESQNKNRILLRVIK